MKEHTKTARTDANQDWVCYNCHNLNYSFRKICNRCKATTRHNNQPSYNQFHYYQMYYHSSYYPNPHQKYEPSPGNSILSDTSLSMKENAEKNQNGKTLLDQQTHRNVKFVEKNDKESFHIDQDSLKMLFDNTWLSLNYENEGCQSKSDAESEQTRGEEWSQDDQEQIRSLFDLSFL